MHVGLAADRSLAVHTGASVAVLYDVWWMNSFADGIASQDALPSLCTMNKKDHNCCLFCLQLLSVMPHAPQEDMDGGGEGEGDPCPMCGRHYRYAKKPDTAVAWSCCTSCAAPTPVCLDVMVYNGCLPLSVAGRTNSGLHAMAATCGTAASVPA